MLLLGKNMKEKLDTLRKPFGFHFISSSENTGDFLCNYIVQLSEERTYILASNFVDYLYD